MKKQNLIGLVWVAVWIGQATLTLAGVRSGGVYTVNDTVDGGGQRAASAAYTMDGSLGGIGGISSEGAATAKQGYVGQLTEVTQLFVLATPAAVNEGGVLQLSGVAGLDDATVSALAASNLLWAAPAFPLASISPAGAVAATTVWSNTCGTVSGTYLGFSGSAQVTVLDSNPDNFGLYAGDQIPDAWQARYFGVSQPQGTAGATNCTGHNNLYSYIADLNPTDPNSVLKIVSLSESPPKRVIGFSPASPARLYRLLYTTNLASGTWANLPGQPPVSGVSGAMSLYDPDPGAARFYRVQVLLP